MTAWRAVYFIALDLLKVLYYKLTAYRRPVTGKMRTERPAGLARPEPADT